MREKSERSMKNINAAFAGESIARNKYTFFAEEARKSGQEAVAILFEKMAENEKEHARAWFQFMKKNDPAPIEGYLEEAAGEENYEWNNMYTEFAKQAKEDGDMDLAFLFEKVAFIEKDHERQFLELLVELKKREEIVLEHPRLSKEMARPEKIGGKYRCILCGNIEDTSLERCPFCKAVASFIDII